MNFFNGTIPSGAPSGPDLGLDVASGKLYFTHPGIAGWQTIAAGTPGGSTTQVQFDDGGVFAGDAQFVWNKTAHTLSLGVADSALNAALQGFWGSNVLDEHRFIAVGSGGVLQALYAQATDNPIEGVGLAAAAFQTGNTAIYVNGGDYEVFGFPSLGKTMDHAYGFFCFASNSGAGTVTDVAGFVSSVQNNGAGATTNLMGALIGPILVPTGSAANVSGLRIQTIAGLAGTRGAALLIDDQGTGANDFAIFSAGGKVHLSLPTADPHVVGVLWANAGVVTVSAG